MDLVWSTASELHSDLFIVERSVDAEHFEPILETPGAGTSLNVLHYAMVDHVPLSGTSYYRLLQMDNDGTVDRSPVVAIHRSERNENVVLYPNPSAGTINIVINDRSENPLLVEITDAMGRTVILENGFAPLLQLDASGLTTGSYKVVVTDRGQVMHKQMWIKL